jgi:aldehyde:ferredoxin oxidoreductase
MDAKEQAAVLGLAIECYEKGLITKKDTDGLELTWGNIEAVEALLYKIATRDGLGMCSQTASCELRKRLAEKLPILRSIPTKVMRLMFMMTEDCGILPSLWRVSDMGSIPAGDMGDVGNLLDTIGDNFLDPARAFDAEYIPKCSALMWRRGHFIDCLGICMFVAGVSFQLIADTLNAVTGWDFTWQECTEVGERVLTMMRSFNVKNGHTRADNSLSPRILEAPINGPAKGVSIAS